MGRMYSAVFDKVAVSAAQDLFELVAPADAAVIVHSIEITNTASETSEALPIKLHRGSTSGSGGSSVTPAPLAVGDPAFGGTCEANNTTQSTEGTIIRCSAFNVLSGWYHVPTPEERIILSPSGRMNVELEAAPAAALTLSGTIVFEEVGG